MKDRVAAYKSQISSVVVASVVDTFNMMLRQTVSAMPAKEPRAPGPDAAVYACVKLNQNNASAHFYFSFDRNLLLLTAGQFYESEESREPAVQEDIACAVANVVGGRVKTFLNRHGYEFEMGIPFPAPPSVLSDNNVISVHFSYDRSGDNGLVVNYVMEDKHKGTRA